MELPTAIPAPSPVTLDLASFDRLVTAHEVAAYLDLDVKTVLRHKERRSFSLNLGHRIVRWYPQDVCRWLEGKRKRATRP